MFRPYRVILRPSKKTDPRAVYVSLHPWDPTMHLGSHNAVKHKQLLDLKYEMVYQLDAIEYLFLFFQLDMFRAYTPIFRSNGCYNFLTYAAYGVL